MRKLYIYLLAIIILLLDQISKTLVISNFDYLDSLTIISSFFYLTYVKNTGGAFSILNNNVILLAIIGILFFFVIIRYILKNNSTMIQGISYSFILGGLLGNLIDRIFRSGVIDFLDFKIFGYDFPVFNFADVFIVTGVVLMIIETLWSDKNENRKGKCENR